MLETNTNDYQKAIMNFTAVSVNDIREIQKSDEYFYLYTGRETCPYCKEFAITLNQLSKQEEVHIYYLDSVSPYESSPPELKEFRDQFSIDTVPSFLIFKGEKIIADFKNYLPNENDSDLINFLNLY